MKDILFKELGLKPYKEVWEYQQNWLSNSLEKKRIGEPVDQEVLFVEHPHVYTLGKSADANNLLINDQFLSSINAEVFNIERGGDITYHGPEQLVVYPLLDLESLNIGVKQYVDLLEECIIEVLAKYKIEGKRMEGKTGIWLNSNQNERKIAAIGIKCSRHLTIHGLAFNINTNLDYFNHIIPCGLNDSVVTSLSKELNCTIEFKQVTSQFLSTFKTNFNV